MNFRNPITNTRTFGSDPDRVLKNAQVYVDTLTKSGLAACCKHFPGDGVDYRDQHLHPSYNSLHGGPNGGRDTGVYTSPSSTAAS